MEFIWAQVILFGDNGNGYLLFTPFVGRASGIGGDKDCGWAFEY